jgi:hypothetical protein
VDLEDLQFQVEKQKFHSTLKLLMYQQGKLWHLKNFLPMQKAKMATMML